MVLTLVISPHGRPLVEDLPQAREENLATGVAGRIRGAFAQGTGAGLLHLCTVELRTMLPESMGFARELGQRYLTRLCQMPGLEGEHQVRPVEAPAEDELAALAQQAPPMLGLEYLNGEVLAQWWDELDQRVRGEIEVFAGGAGAYLHDKNPLWRLVGRVTFHLAENKRDEAHPFAFLATYANRLSAQAAVQHLPMARALQQYAGAKDKSALLSLLTPVQRAAERCPWVGELVEKGGIYQALAWTPKQAHRFLSDIPALEASGLVVKVPDWWKAKNPPRPRVNVQIGNAATASLGVDAMLDFSVDVSLGSEELNPQEIERILASTGGLIRLRGQWVEVDRDKLAAALDHWKQVEREAKDGGISFFEGMRLLSGAQIGKEAEDAALIEAQAWTGIKAGTWLEEILAELRDPQKLGTTIVPGMKAQLRPYQKTGVSWLRFMTRLGLGACLADDMGLGKTIQVLGLLLHLAGEKGTRQASLLVAPASLIANWKAEIARFAPSLSAWVAHPSEQNGHWEDARAMESAMNGADLVITTYGMLSRLEGLRNRKWNLIVLDEAQAIKNSGARQTKTVKELQGRGRIALTGTPVENRLSDLWSLFDFLNPGLLGSAKAFARSAKVMQQQQTHPYAPLRALVRPYILRRLKTDRKVISDLPEKTEIKAYCGLSKQQAVIYQESVRELAETIGNAEGIQRRGIVLAYLMRFKQICNHPSQWLGDGVYDPQHSGKLKRLGELCEEMASRQEKVLIFTQFREMTDPLAEFLKPIFGREGLVLHGGTAVARRREMVEAFGGEEGPPFFILSLKAGGTGLNLTAASQVIHFDRWWNPAVENQATDRAFRIGQKRNVMVHKFVCQGTVEEKIDQLIEDKQGLSRDLLEGGAERMLTEMNDRELLRFVSLDISKVTQE